MNQSSLCNTATYAPPPGRLIAKFHYTDPTRIRHGPDPTRTKSAHIVGDELNSTTRTRTRTDPHGLFCGETPLGPCGSPTKSGRVRVVEFSSYSTTCADFVRVRSVSGPCRVRVRVRVVEFSFNTSPSTARVTVDGRCVVFGRLAHGQTCIHMPLPIILYFVYAVAVPDRQDRPRASPGPKKRAWRHGRAWKMKIRAWKNQDPCFNFYKHIYALLHKYPV